MNKIFQKEVETRKEIEQIFLDAKNDMIGIQKDLEVFLESKNTKYGKN